MRASLFRLIFLAFLTSHADARLGDTLDQAETRYGLPKKPASSFASPLIEGSKELTFELQGWRIRCAFLRATDGKEYIVREEYTKIWNSEVMKAGGSPNITDFEAEAVLKGEVGAGAWKPQRMAKFGNDLLSTLSTQVAHSAGMLGTSWIRGESASARLLLGKHAMILDLPQALKYEAELKAIKDARARSHVPKF